MAKEDKANIEAKVLARVKDRDKMASQLQSDLDDVAKKIKQIIDHDLKTYSMLSNPDCLYSDSPLSNRWTYEWIKQYMIKNDLDFVGFFLDGKINIKSLTDRFSDSSKWAMRFTKEPKAVVTGLDAIL